MPEQPPDTIYLQSNSLYEVWDVGKMDSDDVEYIRADVHCGLIAELLAACRGLLRFIKTFNMGGDWRQDNYPAIKAARAAIQKTETAP